MKTCFKCQREKPRSEFYRHPQMADGLLGKCKDCTRRDAHERERWLRANDPSWVQRERQRCVQKMTDAVQRKWPEKFRARKTVNNAVRRGKLVRPDRCERCGEPKVPRQLHGHHRDYAKPLEVQFVCAMCHAVLDGRSFRG